MELLERMLVRARTDANSRASLPLKISLSPLDLYMGHFITGGVHFFLRPPSIERLADALATAIRLHSSFDACLMREDNLLALYCGNTGVYLSVYRSEKECPDFRSGASLFTDIIPTDNGFPWMLSSGSYSPSYLHSADLSNRAYQEELPYLRVAEPSARYSSSNVHKLSDLPEQLLSEKLIAEPGAHENNPTIIYTLNSGAPVADFRLVLFKDRGCALVFRHVHSLGDGASTFHFLQNWSRIYRGEKVSPPSVFNRADIFRVGSGDGVAPSKKLNIVQIADLNVSGIEAIPDDKTRSNEPISGNTVVERRGAIRIDIAESTLAYFVSGCQMQASHRLSSSEILHALVWQCFALAQPCDDQLPTRIHTLFNLRNLEGLGIPDGYEGSAVLGRSATATYAELRCMGIHELASMFKRHTKPLAVADIQRDIGYLAREYADGHIDLGGHYTRFVIEAWLDCKGERGLIVNDLRTLTNIDLRFEDSPARMEIMVGTEINMVSIYPNDDGTITVHYVGEQATLPSFANHLLCILGVGRPGS